MLPPRLLRALGAIAVRAHRWRADWLEAIGKLRRNADCRMQQTTRVLIATNLLIISKIVYFIAHNVNWFNWSFALTTMKLKNSAIQRAEISSTQKDGK
jgi:hypothetical protein